MLEILQKIIDKLKYNASIVTGINFDSVGWYRLARVTGDVSGWTTILEMAQTYSNGGSNCGVVAISGLYDTAQIKTLLHPVADRAGIKKVRVLYNPGSDYYIDVYYDHSRTNKVYFRFINNILTSADVVAPIVETGPDGIPADIPNGYTAVELDLISGGGTA